MRLAVLPARGGSKRIPRKNIKVLGDKPIIAWSIEAALNSGCFDDVIVSTDDEEIADVAKQFGANVPFFRPAALADDHTETIPVVRHTIDWFLSEGKEIEQVCCIYPTAPFISIADIEAGLRILNDSKCDFVLPVTTFDYPVQRALRVDEEGKIEMLDARYYHKRSQDLEVCWHDAGQFYWGTASAWLSSDAIFGPRAIAMRIPRERVRDIDTPEDWIEAEILFKHVREDRRQ